MKRLFGVVMICILLTTITTAVALPIATTEITATGTYMGNIGYRSPDGFTSIGTIDGDYLLRNRGGRFMGNWSVSNETQTWTGGLFGVFGRHLLVGRITLDGRNGRLPIVGFIGTNTTHFFGRFMAPVGPALYFLGTYSET